MKQKDFIFHSPLIKGESRITVVGRIIDNVLVLGAARCSKDDHFNRKTGVEIATKRIDDKEYISQLGLDEPTLSYFEFINIASAVADSILEDGLKKVVLLPFIKWETILKSDFDLLPQRESLDQDGFVIYE